VRKLRPFGGRPGPKTLDYTRRSVLQTLRNIAIIALIALAITALPGGGAAARTVLQALGMAFLAAIAWFVYRFYREQELTLATITDRRRVLLFGSVGLVVLLIAGYDQFRAWGGGAFVGWIALMVLALVTIFTIWRDATTYS
jgi:4-amino-4-deoxy-L-arabinose transferase-like glycosyltransferase